MVENFKKIDRVDGALSVSVDGPNLFSIAFHPTLVQDFSNNLEMVLSGLDHFQF